MTAGAAAKRFALAGAAFWGLAASAGAGLWYQMFRRSLPRTKGTLRLPGLGGAIEIRRDRWGVPHVRAATAHDLWFGEGFCHGQDRLWQIDLYRRIGSGRLSEIAGRAGIDTDRFMRTLGLRRAEMTRELGAELTARLDPGYPRGNPVVLEPGEPWSGDGLDLAEQIARVRDTLGLAVEATGSNNWAVSGVRSATGGPLLAG